jgi:hypothetical protein
VLILARVANYSVSTGRSFLGKADRSPLSIVEDENEWSSTSTSPMCPHGICRDSFAVTVQSTDIKVVVEVSLVSNQSYTPTNTHSSFTN